MFTTYHLIAYALFAGFAALDLAGRARDYPDVTRWRLKGTAFALLYFALATYAPLFWDGWLGQYRLFAADALPLWQQILGGFLALELGIYAWHRTMHNAPFLWRWFHQMHHSAERVDIWGALYFHPFDTLGFTMVGSLALVVGFGISAEAAIIINLAATFMGLFQHANLPTTSAASTPATMATCHCSTSSSAPSPTQPRSAMRSVSMRADRRSLGRCWQGG